ncbi:DUF4159 domain-containing protein [Maribacter hydrothermalis]|uniref:DUF4159 domain-containing protein n=1 Tax=Maribacter hydrothermalis TaxID=1836467 RepID=A0A1B7ZDN5_9FLAO|nr:DUF4159 domain-containing protein [Maribacter hydrothermalis]APQ18480.1 hypothetical protein BTR34_14650 [Maribacter hydrothermalis]OBR41313.1 hypothetical protein A9200_13445 [Maribacter hydrothermalis]
MKKISAPIFLYFLMFSYSIMAQEIAILKYQGGGDWYANPTALPNLIKFCNANIGTTINNKPETVEVGSSSIFQYPFIHMTGHGNVVFSDEELNNLRSYLEAGGFLHIDDNYGMKPYITREIKRLFPNSTLEELGAEHPIFKNNYSFTKGLPKIHEHDGQRPQALAIFHNNRIVLLFTSESDLGDGWEDPTVHNDSAEIREKALQMGANIITYVFKN